MGLELPGMVIEIENVILKFWLMVDIVLLTLHIPFLQSTLSIAPVRVTLGVLANTRVLDSHWIDIKSLLVNTVLMVGLVLNVA